MPAQITLHSFIMKKCRELTYLLEFTPVDMDSCQHLMDFTLAEYRQMTKNP